MKNSTAQNLLVQRVFKAKEIDIIIVDTYVCDRCLGSFKAGDLVIEEGLNYKHQKCP